MNRDEILTLAREAGVMPIDHFYVTDVFLQRFVHLIEQRLIRDGYRKCASGQRTTQFCGLLDAAVKAEREKVAAWMHFNDYITGHGDTIEDLLEEIEAQVAERERWKCAEVAEAYEPRCDVCPRGVAAAIRARGET